MTPAEIAGNFFKHRQRADHLVEIGRYREALAELSADLAQYPDGYHSLCQSAFCHFQLGEHQKAYDVTKTAIAASPDGEWAHRLQSMIFAATGDNQRSLEAAERSVTAAPDFTYSLHALANAQIGVWRLDDAEKTVERMLEIAPGDAITLDAAGYVALKKEDYAKAENLYTEALQIDPESVTALNNLGVIYLHYAETGKGSHYRQKSAQMFERAVRSQPTFTDGQENLKLAMSPAKAGIPIGMIILACWAASALNNAARQGSKLAPDVLQSLTVLSPYSDSYFVFGLNLLSIVYALMLTAFGIHYYFSKDRASIANALHKRLARWTIALGLLVPFSFYMVFLFLMDIQAPPFSYLALIGLFAASIYAGMRLILYLQLREIENS